jgi:hypothetical protein
VRESCILARGDLDGIGPGEGTLLCHVKKGAICRGRHRCPAARRWAAARRMSRCRPDDRRARLPCRRWPGAERVPGCVSCCQSPLHPFQVPVVNGPVERPELIAGAHRSPVNPGASGLSVLHPGRRTG